MSTNGGVPAFSTKGLVKRFPGFTLGPIDLELQPGTVLGLIGPNGAGKTTMLHCLTGLLIPDGGTAEVFGTPVLVDDPSWRRDIGVVGEEHGFYTKWTTAENLAVVASLQPNFSYERARRMADRFALPLDRKVEALSRGNRAKLAIVVALAHAPRLLLLDEPTAGLDPVVRAEVLDVLWELLEDGEHAIFYSTHVLSDIARLADELVFLSDGRVLQRSAKDDLVDGWRRISFRLAADGDLVLPGIVEHRQVRQEHQVTSRDHEATLAALRSLGAESIEVARLSIDEIAVEILRAKGVDRVAPR
jgi:ABC-2 type transport system ATP-binding protein